MIKKRKKISVLKIGLLLLIGSIFSLILSQSNKVLVDKSFSDSYKNDNKNLVIKKDEENKMDDNWSNYENKDYSIGFSYPPFLRKVEYEEPGEYEYFVVFEENKFSLAKGVAFGISSGGVDEEINRIKEGIKREGKIKVIKEKEIDLLEEKARLIEVEPEDDQLERKSFLVFQRKNFTYSFSTITDQMQKLISSIRFLD